MDNHDKRIDELVARYAPIGARRIRTRRIRRASSAAGCALVVAGAAWLYATDYPILDALVPDPVAPGITAAERAELDRERAEFAAKLADLESRIVDGQALVAMRHQQGSRLDREIAAIAAQREALEERWAKFESQGELLAMEIVAVSTQRRELDAQRRQIDSQQAQLAKLLDRLDNVYRRNASDVQSAAERQEAKLQQQTSASRTEHASSVDPEGLDNMRGGFAIGEGLDVSFGFSQSGAINGVEQYTNHFQIDSMSSEFSEVDMSGMSTYVLQNGTGNFISGNVIDMLASSFGSIIQNTLDDQVISTTTTYDIGLQNISGTLQGLQGEQALMDSLTGY